MDYWCLSLTQFEDLLKGKLICDPIAKLFFDRKLKSEYGERSNKGEEVNYPVQ